MGVPAPLCVFRKGDGMAEAVALGIRCPGVISLSPLESIH